MHPRFRAGGKAAGSLRSAGVWRQGFLPCRQRRAVLARPACGARGLFRPTSAASQRDPGSRAKSGAKASAAGTAALCAFRRVPSRSRRAGGGKAQRVARRMRASLRPVHGRTVRKPRSLLAECAGMDAREPRPRGCLSLVTFFGQAKKVTRPPGMAGEAQQGRRRGFRGSAARENERQNQNGFRPSPE